MTYDVTTSEATLLDLCEDRKKDKGLNKFVKVKLSTG